MVALRDREDSVEFIGLKMKGMCAVVVFLIERRFPKLDVVKVARSGFVTGFADVSRLRSPLPTGLIYPCREAIERPPVFRRFVSPRAQSRTSRSNRNSTGRPSPQPYFLRPNARMSMNNSESTSCSSTRPVACHVHPANLIVAEGFARMLRTHCAL